MPLGDLLARAVHHLVPMVLLGSVRSCSDFKAPDDLVLRHPIPVKDEKLQADVLQAFITGYVEQEGLIEDRVEGSLLDVGFLFRDSLSIVEEVNLHVRI